MNSLNKISKILNITNVNNSKINNDLNNYKEIFEKGGTMTNFFEFVNKKENHGALIVKEHQHSLVYCKSIFDWICNLCKKRFYKKNGNYYCSICDFNMCEDCHSKGNYLKKKPLPDDIKPSITSIINPFLQSKHHEHRLVYCRTSRRVIGYNGWFCNICKWDYDHDVWSFFCTNCDFDLCTNCAGFY